MNVIRPPFTLESAIAPKSEPLKMLGTAVTHCVSPSPTPKTPSGRTGINSFWAGTRFWSS